MIMLIIAEDVKSYVSAMKISTIRIVFSRDTLERFIIGR